MSTAQAKLLIALALALVNLSLASVALAFDEGRLSLWINGDRGYKGLIKVAQKFTADTGVPVSVSHPDGLEQRFQESASNAQGPDILLSTHDHFGEWVEGGLLLPIDPSPEMKAKIDDFAWEAVSIGGTLYGYPIAVETVSLIYNKDLMPNGPPKTFEELAVLDAELQKSGKHAILWAYTSPYFSYPLLAANGGYAFRKKDDGSYDLKDTGITNAGSKQGAAFLTECIEKGLLPRGVDYGVAEASFNKGEVAMTINGPWAWGAMDKSGLSYGVAQIPSLGGNQPRASVSVFAGVINNASPNKDLATGFLEGYLLTPEGLKTLNDDKPLGAVALKELQAQLGSDERIRVTFENAKNGEPIPSVPEMTDYWTHLEGALRNIAAGRQGVDEALDAAAQRMAH